jgi:hypothetical protein
LRLRGAADIAAVLDQHAVAIDEQHRPCRGGQVAPDIRPQPDAVDEMLRHCHGAQ